MKSNSSDHDMIKLILIRLVLAIWADGCASVEQLHWGGGGGVEGEGVCIACLAILFTSVF